MSKILPAGGGLHRLETKTMEFPRLPITPTAEHYGRVPFEEAFDIPEILVMASKEKDLPFGQSMYIVDFASQAKANADQALLNSLDNAAHMEATQSDGFLLYFRGDLDPEGYNRSFCVWLNAHLAYEASHQPAHLEAAAVAGTMYEHYEVRTREAWLEDTDKGYRFGPERVHNPRHAENSSKLSETA